MNAAQQKRQLDTYIANLDRALRMATADQQISGKDLSSLRIPIVHNPYVSTIAERGLFRLACRDRH